MKPSRLLLTVLLSVLAGCATTRPVPPPAIVGTWNYVLKNTPSGDAPGQLRVWMEDGTLKGEMTNTFALQPTVPTWLEYRNDSLFVNAIFTTPDGTFPTYTTGARTGDTINGRTRVEGAGIFRFEAARAPAPGN
jgi:hypothetical protein